MSDSTRNLRAVLAITFLSHPWQIAAESSQALPPVSVAGPTERPAAPTLTSAVLERLHDRDSATVMSGEYVWTSPQRYDLDYTVLQTMAMLGYSEADTFFAPVARVGMRALVVRFRPNSADPRSEAVALFRALIGDISKTGAEYVAIHDALSIPEQTADRYTWLLWHTPNDDWVLIKALPQAYFEANLAEQRTRMPANHTLIKTYLQQLARIEFANARRTRGSKLMAEALQVIETAPADDQVGLKLQLEVLSALMFDAASERDDAQLGLWIKRYALLAARAHITAPSAPVRTYMPEIPEQIHAGEVELEFDVRVDGTTANPTVVSSTATRGVENAAKRAILRFRYMPAVQDGKLVDSKSSWGLQFDAH